MTRFEGEQNVIDGTPYFERARAQAPQHPVFIGARALERVVDMPLPKELQDIEVPEVEALDGRGTVMRLINERLEALSDEDLFAVLGIISPQEVARG